MKLIVLVLGVAVVLGGCSLPGSNSAASTTVPQATAKTTGGNPLESMMGTVTVSYKNGVFSPSPVKIRVGQAVKFVNGGPGAMWVASNPHPTHTDYPGFDAKQGVAVGASYTFVFTKVGTWGYHNHLDPSQGGTVIVSQ